MSVDLTVVPMKGDMYNLAYGLDFDRRNYDKYEKLKKISKPVTINVIDYTDQECENYPLQTEDCYGNPLTTVTIKQFLKVYEVPDLTIWDRGIIALLKVHNQSDRILLYYH